MRTHLLVWLGLLLFGVPAGGAERTWTITVTASAELVEVRGDIVYLKAGETIEGVRLDRLSEADREYIASLPLVPASQGAGEGAGPGPALVRPGSASASTDLIESEVLPAPVDENGERSLLTAGAPPGGQTFAAPTPAPAGGANYGQQGPRSAAYRVDQSGRLLPPAAGGAPNYRSANPNPQSAASSDRRRSAQEQPQRRSASNSGSSREDERPGLLGRRARRRAGD